MNIFLVLINFSNQDFVPANSSPFLPIFVHSFQNIFHLSHLPVGNLLFRIIHRCNTFFFCVSAKCISKKRKKDQKNKSKNPSILLRLRLCAIMGDNSSGSSPTWTKDYKCEMMVEAHSPGLWGFQQVTGLLSYALPRLHLQLVMIFFLTQSLHFCLRRFSLPRITSEIMAGIILGPSALGKITFFNQAFFSSGRRYLS